jgi:hypothetical protein
MSFEIENYRPTLPEIRVAPLASDGEIETMFALDASRDAAEELLHRAREDRDDPEARGHLVSVDLSDQYRLAYARLLDHLHGRSGADCVRVPLGNGEFVATVGFLLSRDETMRLLGRLEQARLADLDEFRWETRLDADGTRFFVEQWASALAADEPGVVAEPRV